jgi:hypothetical protein
MLNSTEGWMISSQGAVFQYKAAPGSAVLAWQRVATLPSSSPLHSLSVVDANEWWGVQGDSLINYKDGVWQVISAPVAQLLSTNAKISRL